MVAGAGGGRHALALLVLHVAVLADTAGAADGLALGEGHVHILNDMVGKMCLNRNLNYSESDNLCEGKEARKLRNKGNKSPIGRRITSQ